MEKTSTGLAENVAGLLCYVLGWVSGLVFILIEQENKVVRFHAMQSIVIFGSIMIVSIALSLLGLIPLDYLTKPFTNIEAAALSVLKAGRHSRLVQRNRELESMLEVKDSFEGLVGSSPGMKRVFVSGFPVGWSS